MEKKYYVVDRSNLYCSLGSVAFHFDPNEDGKWVECDYTTCISDYLYGFDVSKPEGSPYKFGNGDIMRRIQEITEEEAIKRIGEKAIHECYLLFKKGR